MAFEAGDKVVKVMSTMGVDVAYGPYEVTVDDRFGVFLNGEDRVRYDPETGRDVDPVIPGLAVRIITFSSDG